MSTKKAIFNTLIGVLMTIVISILQLTFLRFTSDVFGSEINGLIRVIISFLSYLTLTEGGLGLITIFSLYRPLQNGDYETVNDIINTTRKNYQHSGRIYLIIIVSVSFILGLASEYLPISFGFNINRLPFWQLALLIIALGSKEILFFYFSGAYQNLIQADQKGYLNRLIFIFSEIIMYILIIMLVKLPNMVNYIYIPFIAYFICGLLKVFVTHIVIKIEYPWLQHKKWTQQKRMLKQSHWIALSRLPELIISNIDIILITIFLTLTVTSIYAYYLIVAVTMRSIALILISSFREVFGYWIAKSGRIRWTVYTKFELYAYMIAAFLFINQFIISQYLITAIYGDQYIAPKADAITIDYFNKFFINQPQFILFLSLKNAIQVATEPGKVIVNATVKHKETIWGSYIQALINIVLGVTFAWTLSQTNHKDWALYMIIVAGCCSWIYRLISIWIYVWKNLTYNSDLRFIIQNTLVLILPILITIIFGYGYFFPTHLPKDYINKPIITFKIAGYTLLYSTLLVMILAMIINFRQFWMIFNLKSWFKNLFRRKNSHKSFIYNKQMNDLLKDTQAKRKPRTQTFDWTTTYQNNNSNLDNFIEQEIQRKQKTNDTKTKQTKDNLQTTKVGIYKIRG